MEVSQNPYANLIRTLNIDGKEHKYFSLPELDGERVARLPYSIRVLLESAVRNCDNFNVLQSDVERILDWKNSSQKQIEISFKPARVLLQDFTGVPCVVDLAAMRDSMKRLGGDPNKINPQCPVDLVIDHSVQVDFSRVKDARERNEQIEFERNYERFQFLKWGQKTFDNFLAVPPGSGIVHQVNLEYLARVVFDETEFLYPDSVVGTDSHTTMVNGLGVVGWGVGGIEAESVMLGQVMSMVLPEVIGFKLTGELAQTVTATDLVLTVTQILRQKKVVGKFIEFYGPGVENLSISDRATVSNMAPEYGATIGFFPVDKNTLEYLQTTNRNPHRIKLIEQYLSAQHLFKTYGAGEQTPEFTDIVELDLSTVVPCIAGPKRPQDRVPLTNMKEDWNKCISGPLGFKGYGLTPDQINKSVEFTYQGNTYTLGQGSVIIAAITSCTNTSNPSVMIAAGLLCRNAISKGLDVKPYIKTSLSPGSGVVTQYFAKSGLQTYCDQLGFTVTGFGCMTCIGNSGDLYDEVTDILTKEDLVVAAVLSGNRNFEGRVHPLTRANYLASPPLVVAYALAGTVNIDFEAEPIGKDQDGNDVYLRDIWPSRNEINKTVNEIVNAQMYKEVYDLISQGTERWNQMEVPSGSLYEWNEKSTYIQQPPYFLNTERERATIPDIIDAYCLGFFGDFITTDHISPAGKISKNSPGAKYLLERGVEVRDFNTYGARRGNWAVMARGTFANTRIKNILLNNKEGPYTLHIPSGEEVYFYEAAERYQQNGQQSIILAGKEYGSGSSRDWAAKGPYLQGVKAVIAESYERIHRSNLVGMGILPLQYQDGENAETLGLTGKEQFTIILNNGNLKVRQHLEVRTNTGKVFNTIVRIDTDVELAYYQNGGILNYVLRKLLGA